MTRRGPLSGSPRAAHGLAGAQRVRPLCTYLQALRGGRREQTARSQAGGPSGGAHRSLTMAYRAAKPVFPGGSVNP